MKFTSRFVLPLLLLGCFSTLAQALEIVYPADKTFVVNSDFLIIKGGNNPPLDAMTVEIDGAKSDPIDISGADYRAAFKDFLILQPSFDPGKNLVKVEGFSQGKRTATAQADIFYAPRQEDVVPAGYQPFVMHLPAREALCSSCHLMNPTVEQLNDPAPTTNPCAACHRRMLDRKYVHGPAGVLRCAYCHQPESKPNRYRDRGGDAALCNECHLDKVNEFKSNAFVHGPVAVGMCSICHDPHASDYPAQLVAPINQVCLGCHEMIGKGPHVTRGVGGDSHPLSGRPDPSREGQELSCTSCHDPHGGKSQAYFQRGIVSRFALCQMCHQK